MTLTIGTFFNIGPPSIKVKVMVKSMYVSSLSTSTKSISNLDNSFSFSLLSFFSKSAEVSKHLLPKKMSCGFNSYFPYKNSNILSMVT